jgi:hypothetical protein
MNCLDFGELSRVATVILSLRDGSFPARIPGNESPGYYHLVPKGRTFLRYLCYRSAELRTFGELSRVVEAFRKIPLLWAQRVYS